MRQFFNHIIKFTQNTIVRAISLIFALLFIASFFVFPDFYQRQWNKIQSYYFVYLGDKAYKKNHSQEAINNYTKALSLHPKHVKARYNLANLYVAYEDYVAALENYEEALKLKPDFTVARIDYAIILSEIAFNYDKAIEQYDLAIKNKPKGFYIPFIKSSKNHKYNEGVAYYNQGLAWRGKSLLYGGDKFSSKKYLQKAINSYEKSLKNYKDYDVYYNLGIANQLIGHSFASGKNYCLAIKENPMSFEAHFNLAILLNSMKKYVEAMEEFKKASLLAGSMSNTSRTQYLFGALFDVSQKVAHGENSEAMENISDEKFNEGKVTRAGGKLIISEEFDKAMNESFKNCAFGKEFFNGENLDI